MGGGSVEVLVIGGGQAGLAVGYYLRRTERSFRILDAEEGPGGAWRHTWDSLRLFSPAPYSSLPGWLMPGTEEGYPHRDEVLEYLSRYEERYDLPVDRPVRVEAVVLDDATSPRRRFRVLTDQGEYRSRAVVSATGTAGNPLQPTFPGQERFRGRLLHSVEYRSPEDFQGERVLVVGGGNSGAQVVADLQGEATEVRWFTREPPTYLPDDVDGRDLFENATARYRARQAGKEPPPARSLGDIVMVPPVKKARDQGYLRPEPLFRSFTEEGVIGPDGEAIPADAVIWCTGFRPNLEHLHSLHLPGVGDRSDEPLRIPMEGTRVATVPGLWLVGYGNWTGYASATLIGVGRTARQTAEEVARFLEGSPAISLSPP